VPLYEYQCESCGERFEVIQKFSDPPAERCTNCGKGPVRRLLSSPAIQFKGTGWYVTDYAQKGSAASESADKGEGKTDEKKAETTKGEGASPESAKTEASAAKSSGA
jgi:putative FmdB family regulatory protein